VQNFLRLFPNDVQDNFPWYGVYSPEAKRTQQQSQIGATFNHQIAFITAPRNINGAILILKGFRESAVA
jgi:hypothetical protein